RMRSQEADPQKVLRTALARAGLVDYWVHSCRRCKKRLRHTTATMLLRERVDAHRVQRLLRHRDVKTTTGTYGHLVVEDLRDAINLLPPSPFAASLLEDPEVDACSRAEFDDRERGESGSWIGAGNGSRTRHPQLGKANR